MTLGRTISARTLLPAAAVAFLAAFAGVLPGCERETRDTDIKVMSVGQTKLLWDKQMAAGSDKHLMFLIDPRPDKDFKEGHILGAKHLQLPQVDIRADRDPGIEKFETIVVYGDNPGTASARGMTKRLIAVGYNHIRFFAGGMLEWKNRGYPIEGAPPAPKPEPAPAPAKPDAASTPPKANAAPKPATPDPNDLPK